MGGLITLMGFLVVYGSVGGIENDGPLLTLTIGAVIGLVMMWVGVNLMNTKVWR